MTFYRASKDESVIRDRSLVRVTMIDNIETILSFTGMTDAEMIAAIRSELEEHKHNMAERFGHHTN